MIKYQNMNLNNLVLIMLIAANSILAQDISTTEVKILEGFKPSIAEAKRLNENATYKDTIKKDRMQSYEVIDVSLKSNYKTRLLTAAKVKDGKIKSCTLVSLNLLLGMLGHHR